jgi:hypothetical protein
MGILWGWLMKYIIAAIVCCLSATATFAAELAMVNRVVGKNVTLQNGEGTLSPGVQTLLVPGDRLTVGKASSIEVKYLADNCIVRVDAGGSITIGDTSSCSAAAVKTSAEATADPAVPSIIPVAAGAVEVSAKNGTVTRVNMGDGLVEASVGDALKEGDEVFAGANSSVTLYFAVPGCTYTVPAGTFYKVSASAPCEVAATAENSATEAVTDAVEPGVVLGAGAAAVGTAALIAITMSDDDGGNNSDNPATPN